MYRSHVLVCGGTGCTSSGSPKIMEALKYEIKRQGLEEEVAVVETGCHGLCALGPIMIVYPDATFYSMVQVNDIPEIVSEHLLKGRVVTRLLYQETVSPTGGIKALIDTDFYKKQHRIALRNCGVINPENIEEYIGTGGYQALGKVLTEMTPDDVIQTLLDAGLRGRGGAGFPTGLKWKLCKQNDADQKYVCCNADEGDPGAFMDRSVLEGDPHSVIEAMTIAGYAIGAHQGYIYVRAEYPIAVHRLQVAIGQAKEYGLLGENIFDTGFSFDLELRLGAGAFVCGEETALMTSIEGKRGEPHPRPPFPANKGLFERPTLLNNVETYANITWILNNGPDKFAAIGTKGSTGTKVFALGGKINNTGLVEVPMGTTLRTVVDEIGGGICQTSSTLYLACLLSNLEITERYAHRYVPAYIAWGMDATVSWGGPDYKFTNNTLYPVKIVTKYEKGYLTVQILGTNVDGTYVKMSNEVLSKTPWETIYQEDPTMAPGSPDVVKVTPYTGYKVNSYQTIYDKDGKVIDSHFEASSNYKVRNKVILQAPAAQPGSGTAEIPAVTPDTPSDTPVPMEPTVPAEPAASPDLPVEPEIPAEP